MVRNKLTSIYAKASEKEKGKGERGRENRCFNSGKAFPRKLDKVRFGKREPKTYGVNKNKLLDGVCVCGGGGLLCPAVLNLLYATQQHN